jgi:acyl-CoA reductase-like NAD-dependent aldehyde dehydrogenase
VSCLVTGNCVILKPSPFTPYSVLKSIELIKDIVPPGVVQVLNGGADLGAAMTLHPGIAKISFTGTIATGKLVMANCAKSLKRITLELAGNDASIVCDDVDVAKVAGQVATGGFFNAGQMCVATKRVYVHESIYDEFIKAFSTEVNKAFAIAEDAQAMSLFGPVSNKMQYDVVKDFVEDCKQKGYEIVSGGEIPTGKGYWIPPTIVSRPPEDSLIVKEEQFGKEPRISHVVNSAAIAYHNQVVTNSIQDQSFRFCPGPTKMTCYHAPIWPTPVSVPPFTLRMLPEQRRLQDA